MASHVVSSFLLRVLASKTTFWMAWIFQQPIRCFYFMVSGANTRIKTNPIVWKPMKNWSRKCLFSCDPFLQSTESFERCSSLPLPDLRQTPPWQGRSCRDKDAPAWAKCIPGRCWRLRWGWIWLLECTWSGLSKRPRGLLYKALQSGLSVDWSDAIIRIFGVLNSWWRCTRPGYYIVKMVFFIL